MTLFFVALCYASYRIVKARGSELRVYQAVVDSRTFQPAHDAFGGLTEEMRSQEVLQLERVFANGYEVTSEGDWRG